jgi:hypothetical protein
MGGRLKHLLIVVVEYSERCRSDRSSYLRVAALKVELEGKGSMYQRFMLEIVLNSDYRFSPQRSCGEAASIFGMEKRS